jgi:hypothetical protein
MLLRPDISHYGRTGRNGTIARNGLHELLFKGFRTVLDYVDIFEFSVFSVCRRS